MSLRFRLVVLTSAGLIAAGYTAALAVAPLCSVFRSTRHHSTRAMPGHTSSAPSDATPTTLAAHH